MIFSITLSIPLVLSNGLPLDDLKIGNLGNVKYENEFYAWCEAEWPYELSDFLWRDRERCRPPLVVAPVADGLALALETGDPKALSFASSWFSFGSTLEEELTSMIGSIRYLAEFCRWAVASGADEVTVAIQGDG